MSKNGTGYVGIDKDYFVSVKEVLNITAETGALETQDRVRELPPADVVEVVRCKDCKFNKAKDKDKGVAACGLMVDVHNADDYCSYGERKEQENE